MIGSSRKSISNSGNAAKNAAKPATISSLAEKRRQRKREKLSTSEDKNAQFGPVAAVGELLQKSAMGPASAE